jgi:hypothetical protein
MLIVQFVLGCSAALMQLSVSVKAPLAIMPEIVTGVAPVFVAVTVCALLDVPTV